MLHCLMNTLGIVDANVRAMGARLTGIHEHSRNVPSRQFCHQARIGLGGHDGDSVYFAFHHAPYTSRHALRVVICVSNDDFLAAPQRRVLKALYQFREKGVCNIRNDQAHHAAPARYQGASMGIGIKIELLDGLLHSGGCPWIHLFRIVNSTGDGRRGNFRSLGYFSNVHASPRKESPEGYSSKRLLTRETMQRNVHAYTSALRCLIALGKLRKGLRSARTSEKAFQIRNGQPIRLAGTGDIRGGRGGQIISPSIPLPRRSRCLPGWSVSGWLSLA